MCWWQTVGESQQQIAKGRSDPIQALHRLREQGALCPGHEERRCQGVQNLLGHSTDMYPQADL